MGLPTSARSAVTEGESQSQDLEEEEEELRGCLVRQQVNKVRPMEGGGPSGAHQCGLVPSASAPNTHLFCGASAHSGTGATMWGRPCCTEPASRASCAASRTLCGRWACARLCTLGVKQGLSGESTTCPKGRGGSTVLLALRSPSGLCLALRLVVGTGQSADGRWDPGPGPPQASALREGQAVGHSGSGSFPSLVTGSPLEPSGLLWLDTLARGLQLWASG